ncbi:MAG: ImmA/IrrE family metallo-endopeptidase [Aestuariivirga sp.]
MNDWLVSALSAKTIHAGAQNLRCMLGFADSYVPNLCGILEHHLRNLVPQYDFAVVDEIKLENGGFAEAQTEFSPPRITFNLASYQKLLSDEPHARFTAAHEIGHLFLHEGHRVLNRMPEKSRAMFQSRSAEWQANEFAAAFLAPEHLLREFESPDDAAQSMLVSLRTAQIRMTQLKLWPKVRDISAWTKLREEMGFSKN